MTQIIAGTKTEFAIDPAILALLPEQGCVELQRDAAGKIHHFHGPVWKVVGIRLARSPSNMRVSFQAARSIG